MAQVIDTTDITKDQLSDILKNAILKHGFKRVFEVFTEATDDALSDLEEAQAMGDDDDDGADELDETIGNLEMAQGILDDAGEHIDGIYA